MTISKEEFVQWKEEAVTQWVFRYLESQKQDYLEDLGNGKYSEEMQQKVVGRIQAYNDLLLIDWEE